MDPVVIINSEDAHELLFTIENIDVSIANAIRRTILADIPTVVFRTTPHELNDCVIYKNSTRLRLHNEIIKQRLSSIPIHNLNTIKQEVLDDYILEVNVENTTHEPIMVTTKDFRIKLKSSGEYLPEEQVRQIFPPNKLIKELTGKEYYIDFVQLRPMIAGIPGDCIHFTCTFSWGTASEDGMFNVVSTCSYGATKDETKVSEAYENQRQILSERGLTEEELHFELKNWLLLDSFRLVKENSFDFIIESVGVYNNRTIVVLACDAIIEQLEHIEEYCLIEKGNTTMPNDYVILLQKGDYTIGKALEKMLYVNLFEGNQSVSFCGFRKAHPHDTFVSIMLCYLQDLGEEFESIIMADIKQASQDIIMKLGRIREEFSK
jgi:DNA-directed RNA polymerase subunit L